MYGWIDRHIIGGQADRHCSPDRQANKKDMTVWTDIYIYSCLDRWTDQQTDVEVQMHG